METSVVASLTLILTLGIMAQWMAWRFHIPAIVLLALGGCLAGPVFGLLNPEEVFGNNLGPFIGMAVSIILFEGGLTLNFQELKETGQAVKRLVYVGAPIAWVLTSLLAYHFAGLEWGVSWVFGGILVVTGPTVIMPLLRQARLKPRVSSVLKWEGIVNDPVGALLAVLVYEFLTLSGSAHGSMVEILGGFLLKTFLAGLLGWFIGRTLASAFVGGHVPEFLKGPVILVSVLLSFSVANALQKESGLVTVTVLGIVLANCAIASIEEMRKLKEYLTVVLVSSVFIVLTATLKLSHLQALDWKVLIFLVGVLFVVRPVSVLFSMIGTKLEWPERFLVAWIAPRGVVAVAVSGFFAIRLVESGFPSAERMIPLSFAIVFTTVIAHGFSLGWLGRKLGLSAEKRNGVVLVGSNDWSVFLGQFLKSRGFPVLMIDNVWAHLNRARMAELRVHYGEVLSELSDYQLDLTQFGSCVACTDNDSFNSLVSLRFAHEMERIGVFQLPHHPGDVRDPHGIRHSMRGKFLLRPGLHVEELQTLITHGWRFAAPRLSEEFTFEKFQKQRPEAVLVALIRDSRILFVTQDSPPKPQAGDTVVVFGPPRPNEVPVPVAPEPSIPALPA